MQPQGEQQQYQAAQSALQSAMQNAQGQIPAAMGGGAALPQVPGMSAPGQGPMGESLTGGNPEGMGQQPLFNAGNPAQGALSDALKSDPRYQTAIQHIGNFLNMVGHPLAQAFNTFHGLPGGSQAGLPQMGGMTAGAMQVPASPSVPQTTAGRGK